MKAILAAVLVFAMLALYGHYERREESNSSLSPAAERENRRENERALRQIELAKRLATARPSTLPSTLPNISR